MPSVISPSLLARVALLVVPWFAATMRGDDAVAIWHSQPVRPGQSVLVYGDRLTEARVVGTRLKDTPAGWPGADRAPRPGGRHLRPLTVIQPRERALKAILPDEPPGVYALEVSAGGRTQRVLVNAPQVWWARGAGQLDAVAGSELRVFGLGLGWRGVHEALAGEPPRGTRTRIVLTGARTVELATGDADLYSARAPLPGDLPPGDYAVWVHNGCGGPEAWGRCPEPLRVRQPAPWPDRVHNVLRFGARGDGVADDTDAVQAALDAAGSSGGGIVLCPAGQYRFNRPLRMPRRVLLRGEHRDKSLLYWSNRHFARLRGIVHGEAQFGLEDLTIWYAGAERGIENMAEVEGKSLYSTANRPAWWQEGDIVLRRLVIRWSPYAARPGWGQLSDTIELTRQLNFESLDAAGKGVAVWLCGRDIRVEDCDIYSGGFPLLLAFHSDGSLVRNNILRTGRGGLVWAQRGRKVIWEDNQMLGADNLSRAGWSTKAHPYYDQVYFRGNTVAFAQSADYEIVGSDGASPVYYGRVEAGRGRTVRLRKPVRAWPFDPEGHLAFVLAGRGKGQARAVVRGSSQEIEVDRPWDVALDDSSLVGINHSLRQWLMVGNHIADGDSMQMYGLNHEVVFAENRLERVGGSSEAALRFLAFQHTSDGPEAAEPSFFSQMLGNRLVAHRMDLRRFESGTAAMELSGGDVDSLGQAETPCLMNAAVLRGNHIQGGKILVSVGSQRPFRAEDLLIEDNRIDESPVGIEIGARTAGVMLRRNTLAAVVEPLAGEGIATAWMEPGAKTRHWLGSLEGVVRRLDAGAWPAIVADLPRDRRADPDSQRLALQRAATAKVTRTLVPPHHPDLARVLWGARVEVRADPVMESLLDSGSGGEAALRVQVHPGGPDGPDCRVDVDWPPGWTALPVDGPAPGDRGAALRLPVRLPPGAQGSFSFLARVTLRVGDSPVSWQETVSVGSGSVGDWRVLGPMPAEVLNRAATRLQPTHPGGWRLDEPVDLGPDGPWNWRSVPGTHRLDASSLPGGIATTPEGIVGAFMLASFVAGQDLWAELTASTGAPGGGLEIQVHLDGRELWDLRLGRETWSPKRLPLKVSKGRHWLLVTGRGRRAAPDISLAIRELGVPTGGRIHPVPTASAPSP